MSLYQCEHCGCRENTATGNQPFTPVKYFDWTGLEDRKGKHLCSACSPTKYRDGTDTGLGVWHNRFPRMYLPMAMFVTNDEGNLAHKETGDIDCRKYEIQPGASNGTSDV